MVVAVVFLAAVASLVWVLGMRLRSCRSTRRLRCVSRTRPSLEDAMEGLDGKREAVECVEKVRVDPEMWTWIPVAEAEGVGENVRV
jgi:hypothetical protein